MRGGATFTGQNAFGCQHTMHVIRLGEWADHDDILFFNIVHLFYEISVEIDLPNGSAR